MADCRHERYRGTAYPTWPWEPESTEVRGRRTRITGGAWPLHVATLLVLAGGYGWLGFAADGGLGALVGCAAGLVTGALLHFLVNSAVSGTSMRRRPRRSRRTSPRPVR